VCRFSWRDIPSAFGDWNTIYHRFNLWLKKGVLLQLITALKQSPDFECGFVDGSIADCQSTSACLGGHQLKMNRLVKAVVTIQPKYI
jgi:putative transposase